MYGRRFTHIHFRLVVHLDWNILSNRNLGMANLSLVKAGFTLYRWFYYAKSRIHCTHRMDESNMHLLLFSLCCVHHDYCRGPFRVLNIYSQKWSFCWNLHCIIIVRVQFFVILVIWFFSSIDILSTSMAPIELIKWHSVRKKQQQQQHKNQL